jgi:cation diffusion facilitator CzcD-associated flavoprotein CzcO
MTLNSWKSGTPEIVQHNVLKEYIQDTASKTGLDAITLYNTRVEHAAKQGSKWHVETTTLSKSDSGKLGKISRAWVIRRPQ